MFPLRRIALLLAASLAALVAARDPFSWTFDLLLVVSVVTAVVLVGTTARAQLGASRLWRRLIGGALLVGATLLAAMAVIAAVNPRWLLPGRTSDAAWAADLEVLRQALDALPPGLDERARARALPELAALQQQLSALSPSQRVARLARVVAALDDGHSIVSPFLPPAAMSLVPLRVRRFADGWFVIDAAGAGRALRGARLLTIGGLDVDDAYAAVRPFVSADNESAARVRAGLYMMSPTFWCAIGRQADCDRLVVEVTDRTGQRAATLRGRFPLRYLWWVLQPRDWILPPRRDPGHAVSFEWRAEPWWVIPLPERRAVYVALRAIRANGDRPLAALAADALERARSIGAERLVIDLRDNGGGDNTLFRGFVDRLAASEFNATGRLFVLTGGWTFSAATNLVTTLERRTSALFVGEPTGSGPNHYGDARMHLLPRTRIAVFLSTRTHRFGEPTDVRTAHTPDVAVATRAADYVEGRDSTLEAALRWPLVTP
jgi:hypothetical protein